MENIQVSKELDSGSALKGIYDRFKTKCNDISFNLEQKKIDINENDSLCDKTTLAFLADLLNSFKSQKGSNNESQKLLGELRQNENLTKNKLMEFMKIELGNHEKLNNSQKEQIGKFIGSKYGGDFCVNLMGNKIKEINDITGKAQESGMKVDLSEFKIEPKDVIQLTTGVGIVKVIAEKGIKFVAKNVVKNVMKAGK